MSKKKMKYYIHYSYDAIYDSNIEEQGIIECKNLIHAVFTYIRASYGAYDCIEPAGSYILSEAFHLKLSINKH